MTKFYRIPAGPDTRRQGSALLLTLLVVSLMLVLVLGFTVFIRIELRQSLNRQRLIEARANARLGIHIALAELQAAAGADQRSAARANLMHRHTGVGGPSSVFPPQLENPLDTRSLWAGISHSDGTSDIGSASQPVVWLVSGLDPTQSPAQQLTSALNDPVSMLTLRDSSAPGAPISVRLNAGKMEVRSPDNSLLGKYAWVIDDETLKAKLAPSLDVRNAAPSQNLTSQRTVLPGFFNLTPTTGLNGGPNDLFRATRLKDMILGTQADASLLESRYFDYTTLGFGVLADTRLGGLKRDLTAAYENPAVFNALFPDLAEPPYITMDMDKFNSAGASDLRNNGYIHHGIFRDYYGLKDKISGNSLPMSVVDKRIINNSADDETRLGNVGPHVIDPARTFGHPYGNFTIWSGENGIAPTTDFGHNPITPIMAFLQQNAWIEAVGAVDGSQENPSFGNYTQIWAGVYNPYNVELDLTSYNSYGPMFRGYPMVRIYVLDGDTGILVGREGANAENDNFVGHMLRPNRFIFTEEGVALRPGRTQVYGFKQSLVVNDTEGYDNNNQFSKDIATSVNSVVFRDRNIKTTPVSDGSGGTTHLLPELDMLVEMPFVNSEQQRSGDAESDWNGPSLTWGLSYRPNSARGTNAGDQDGHELAQVFYLPFTSDVITDGTDSIDGASVDKGNRPARSAMGVNSPGVQFYRESVPFQQSRMSIIDEAFYRFKLRTTKETGSSLRPLIDSNIRAIWNNPKWDTGLGLDALASYSFSSNKAGPDDPTNLAQPDGNEAYLSYGNGTDNQGSQQVVLFDIPRESLVSIGQLQHAAAGRFSYEPTYIVGNSYANVRIPRESWSRTNATDTYSSQHGGLYGISGTFSLFDASYLVNEALFDGYTFTTIPQNSTELELEQFFRLDRLLPNPRHLPYAPEGFNFNTGNLHADTSGRTNAGYVLLDGAFNVNSTSVEAWEVFLSGTKGLPYTKMNNEGTVTGFEPVDGVRFPRVQTILGEPWETAPDPDAWFGFRELTTAEVRLLAEAIVQLIQDRGPFHTLSEFINRPLQENESGTSGVLQTALDAVINSSIPSSFENDATAAFDQIAVNSTQGAGFPTQLLQGDLLQALAPYMQTRSDTFTIRSYGEHAETGTVVRAEAVVQRVSDPIPDSGGGTALDQLANPTSPFGRRFEIVSFRWVMDDEI